MSAGAAPAVAEIVQGLSNFRDFGGLPLAAGGRIARGRFYRSAAPDALSPEGARALTARGIATIVDLRSAAERRLSAALADGGLVVVSTPVEPGTSAGIHQAFAEGSATPARMRALMLDTYRDFVVGHADAFGAAIATMLQSSTAVMVHCTAGKDRTGFVVAVLQRLLGASAESVMADYLRTNTAWDRASIAGRFPPDDPRIEPMLIADADYLDAAFAEIARIDGSVEAFVARAAAGRFTTDHIQRFIDTGETV